MSARRWSVNSQARLLLDMDPTQWLIDHHAVATGSPGDKTNRYICVCAFAFSANAMWMLHFSRWIFSSRCAPSLLSMHIYGLFELILLNLSNYKAILYPLNKFTFVDFITEIWSCRNVWIECYVVCLVESLNEFSILSMLCICLYDVHEFISCRVVVEMVISVRIVLKIPFSIDSYRFIGLTR